MKPQIPWLRVFVEGVVIGGRAHRARGGRYGAHESFGGTCYALVHGLAALQNRGTLGRTEDIAALR